MRSFRNTPGPTKYSRVSEEIVTNLRRQWGLRSEVEHRPDSLQRCVGTHTPVLLCALAFDASNMLAVLVYKAGLRLVTAGNGW